MSSCDSERLLHARFLTQYQDKSRIVEEGNWWKFTNSKEKAQLTEMLLATGDRELVEVSYEAVPPREDINVLINRRLPRLTVSGVLDLAPMLRMPIGASGERICLVKRS